MNQTSFAKSLSRSVIALLTIALIATMAFGQNLVIGGTPTFTGSGTINVKGAINNSVPATISGTVILNGTAGQTIGTTGALTFSALDVNTSGGSAALAVSTNVSSNLSIAAGSTFAVGTNSLNIGGTSSIGALGALTTAAGSTVDYSSAGAGQAILGGFTYAGNLTLSGGTKSISTAVTVGQVFDASTAGKLTISGGGLTLGTTGSFAAVDNNSGTIAGGSGAATFSGLLTQGGGNLSSGSGGLALNAGLTNTSGNITVGAGESMSISGGQFAYTAGTLTFNATSTVTYGGSATNIVPATYGNLTINTDAKIFPVGTTNVATLLTASSNMTINGTLAMSTAAANANIAADFTDNGTFTAASGAGVVNFNGAAQAIGGSATPTFRNLTLGGTGTKTASTGIDIASGGQLAVNQTLAMSGANVLTMKSGALTPSFTGLTEITGSMAWEAPTAASYTFNNSGTIVTFAGADGTRTFTLKSAPGTYPTGNSVGHTVNRSYTATYTNWSTGNVDLQLAYLQAEGSTLGVNEAKLKDFQNGGISSANKVVGTPTRVTSGAGSFGSIKYSALTTAQLLPATNNALAMDDRFNMFNSIASTAWDVTTTWDAGAVPTSTDDVVITGTHAVTIPNALAASALSVTIDGTGTNTLTVGGGASGTLAIGTGGLINNNTVGGLAVAAGGAVTITGSNLTNNGAITNAGTITVQ